MTLEPVSFRKGREHKPSLSKPRVHGRNHARFWTEEEDAVIRAHYPTGGAEACRLRLNRARGAVYQRARALGLTRDGEQAHRKRFIPTDEFNEQLREEWAKLEGRGSVNALAERLGLPRHTVTKHAVRLGLTMPHKKEPPWTAAEDALMRKVPLHSPELAARQFRAHGYRRTPTAIVIRAKRLGLSRRDHANLSARAAAKILGVDDKVVTAWCIAGDLKAGRRQTARLPQQGGDVWAIEAADLRQFIIDHLERIDFRRVDKFELVRLLTMPVQENASNSPGPEIGLPVPG